MSLASDVFAFLHRETLRNFGSADRYLWWPATEADAKAGRYTVRIAIAEAPLKQDENPVLGYVSAPMDGLSVHCAAAEFPTAWKPRPQRLCLIGADNGSGAPAADCLKYQITGVTEPPPYHPHYDLQLQRTS